MTSLDRVLAALGGQKQTRPPFTMTLSLYGARLIGCAPEQYYSNANRYFDGQVAVHDLCSPDILFSPFALIFEAAAFGTELHYMESGPPIITKPAVRSAKQFSELSVPDINSNRYICYIRESVRMLAGHFGKTVPICGIVTAPVDLPSIIMGIDLWIETIIYTPDLARAIIDITLRHFISLANALLEDGASFIAIPMVCINPVFMLQRFIDEIFVPAITVAFSQIKGPIVFHHGGNPLASIAKNYCTIPNVAGFAFDSRDSLDIAREQIGPQKCMLGNLNGPSLSSGTTESALEKVRTILKDRRNDPHFIFATSGADVPWNTPPERIRAIADTIRSWDNGS
jgi:uroporphyrinogen decarboxylase